MELESLRALVSSEGNSTPSFIQKPERRGVVAGRSDDDDDDDDEDE